MARYNEPPTGKEMEEMCASVTRAEAVEKVVKDLLSDFEEGFAEIVGNSGGDEWAHGKTDEECEQFERAILLAFAREILDELERRSTDGS